MDNNELEAIMAKLRGTSRVMHITYAQSNMVLAGIGVVLTTNPGMGMPDFMVQVRDTLTKAFPDQVPYQHDQSDAFAEITLSLSQLNGMVTALAALLAAIKVGIVVDSPHTDEEVIATADAWYAVITDAVPEITQGDQES